MGRFSGAEGCFDGIRNFIMEGGRTEDFVSWAPRRLAIGQHKAEGHMLIAEADYLQMRAKMQFFAGPAYSSQAFTVSLGANPARVVAPTDSHGHFYAYFYEPTGGFDGGAFEIKGVSNTLLH